MKSAEVAHFDMYSVISYSACQAIMRVQIVTDMRILLLIPRHTLLAGHYVFMLAVRVSVLRFVRLSVLPSVVRPSVRPHFVSVR